MSFSRLIWKSITGFFRDDGLMLSASLSYFSMMAMVPFCLFLVTVFGHLLGNYPAFNAFLQGRLTGLFPAATNEIARDIVELISHRGIGTLSLILYGLLSLQLFAAIDNSLRSVFKIKKKRSFIGSVAVSVAVVTLIILLISMAFAAASVIPLIKALKPYVPAIKLGRLSAVLIGYVLPFIMVLVTMTFVYRIIPKAAVRMADALKGAVVVTILLEAAKHVFTWYVMSFARLGKIYGPLTAFVVFLLWIFYSSCLFLFGAEIVYNLGSTGKKRGEK